MSVDRFIDWGAPPEWGSPTIHKLEQVARHFLGASWTVRVNEKKSCWIECSANEDYNTFPLASENKTQQRLMEEAPGQRGHRCFEVFFLVERGKIKQTSVITRHCDEFTDCLADGLAKIYARWWNGTVRWPS